jgi:hypothetical protein
VKALGAGSGEFRFKFLGPSRIHDLHTTFLRVKGGSDVKEFGVI